MQIIYNALLVNIYVLKITPIGRKICKVHLKKGLRLDFTIGGGITFDLVTPTSGGLAFPEVVQITILTPEFFIKNRLFYQILLHVYNLYLSIVSGFTAASHVF